LNKALKRHDLATWRRAKAVTGYLAGERVVVLSEQLDVARSSVNRWLKWFDAGGAAGLEPRPRPGAASRLTQAELVELAKIIEAGSEAAGYQSGVWTGPGI
jgi:transposase